jgi:two-component system response regulator FlrC
MLMPFDGGLALLKAIRRVSPTTPVIIVTAFGDWESYAQAMELGASAFISKPLRMAELTAAVHSALAAWGAATSP